jgi:hypothetical protein
VSRPTIPKWPVSAEGRLKRRRSPASAQSPRAVRVSMPRRHRSRAIVSAQGEEGQSTSTSRSQASRRCCRERTAQT